MKMLPVQLSLNPPLGLWSDVLWRCPPAPPSQLAELKTQLPPSLPSDPRLWSREDVGVFLHFCEREFDLPKVDHDLFQMNGKALCLLTRSDFGHRCPGAGDVLHNVLQMLIIESHMMQWHLPNSPVTPTSRYPLSPHSHPPTPTWPPIAPPDNTFHNAHMHHFLTANSVTLSPPPSVDSQASSPPQNQEQSTGNGVGSLNNPGSSCILGGSASASSSSNSSVSSAMSVSLNTNTLGTNHTVSTSSSHSDSDEEGYSETAISAGTLAARNNAAAIAAAVAQYNSSPPTTPVLKDLPQKLSQQIGFVWSQKQNSPINQKIQGGNSGSVSAPTTPSYMQSVKREFFPENPEPNTNGRLLWDFLQQLLNDRNQKYSDLIAWKCRDTGVFKIVDPAGLAKLWGIQKNHLSMNYDKMSRALRYYYRVNILRKVQGERHCYQFLRNPTELKNIKNISQLRQSVSCTSASNSASSSTNNNNNNNNNSNASTVLNNTLSSNSATIVPSNQQPSSSKMNSTKWTQQSPPRSLSLNSSNYNQKNLSNISQSTAAVVAAAAAAYGPPPTSPLFMHAINGAFHYLPSTNTGPPPNSPAMPSTSSENFKFTKLNLDSIKSMKHEIRGEEMTPTDLSVTGNNNEKRPYNSPSGGDEDCYHDQVDAPTTVLSSEQQVFNQDDQSDNQEPDIKSRIDASEKNANSGCSNYNNISSATECNK